MSEYNAVPPQNYDPNSAFADAVQRARQIAAKIHSGVDTTGTKRTLEDIHAGFLPDSKKQALSDDKGIVQQLATMQAQRALGGIASAISVEEWKVPDKMVGLIIGRGGEQITRLQAESACKVQMAADSGGLPDRICTLTGSRQAIEKAKDLMNSIINRGGPPLPVLDTNHVPDGHSIVEMMIPGPKVGLVIGKGGETIRNLQERASVKMVLIQDGPQQTSQEKPLRITGEPDKCEYAKQLVMDLITEKELESIQRGGFDNTNEYGSAPGGQRPGQPSGNSHEIMVPKQAVGVVIGKGGDMIKKIQQDSGARVQFLNVKDEGPEDKVCVMTGSPDQIQAASNFINELIQSVILRDQQNVGRGRGRGRTNDGSSTPGSGSRGPRPDLPEQHYAVPSNKCGLVIGKGGETVKSINQTSGSYVTLSALVAPNPQDKIFIIRGQPQQIEHAKELINERIGGVGTVLQTNNPQNQQNFPPQFQQQQQFQQGPGQPQPYAPQGWANAYQPWQGQGAPAADPNAAAWAAYYSQFYSQQQQMQQQQQQMQQQQMQQQPAQAALPPGVVQPAIPAQPDQSQTASQNSGPATAGNTVAAAPVPATPVQQPDYSAAWAEYYRSLGMFREAEMIENQSRATAQMAGPAIVQQPGQAFAQPQPTTTAPTPVTPASAPQPPVPQPPVPPGQNSPATSQPAPPAPQPPAPPTSAPPPPTAQVPTGVPAPGPPQQPYPPGQAQWPGPFPQQFSQQPQPNAFVGFNYPQHFGQQQFTAAAPQ